MLAQIARLFTGASPSRTFNRYDDWHRHPFYTNAGQKSRRLADIARRRNALKDELAKVIKAKKARAPIYAALRALSVEELRLVSGR
jgi:hypothetical protein